MSNEVDAHLLPVPLPTGSVSLMCVFIGYNVLLSVRFLFTS
jgi:hypothetical protein